MAFGMSGIDMASVLGFYGLAFGFVQVCLAIQAANYGFSMLSVEERDLTADFSAGETCWPQQDLDQQIARCADRPDHHQYRRMDQQFGGCGCIQRWKSV